MTWTYETTGELNVGYGVNSAGLIINTGTAASQKSKSIKNIKTPEDDESGDNWETVNTTIATIFGYQTEGINYWRGKAVLN